MFDDLIIFKISWFRHFLGFSKIFHFLWFSGIFFKRPKSGHAGLRREWELGCPSNLRRSEFFGQKNVLRHLIYLNYLPWGINDCYEWLRFKRGTVQLDLFIFIWFSLIVYWCREKFNCTYTDSSVFRIDVLCIRFAKHTIFDLGALLSPRLSVFGTFAYLNHFCLISTQTNLCCLVCFIFIEIHRLLKNSLR